MWKPEELSPQAIAAKLYPLIEKQRFGQIRTDALYLILQRLAPEKVQSIVSSENWHKIQQLLLNDEPNNRRLGSQLVDGQFSVNVGIPLQKVLTGSEFANLQKLLIQVEMSMKTGELIQDNLVNVAKELKDAKATLKTSLTSKQTKLLTLKIQQLTDEERYLEYQLSNTDDPIYDHAMVVGLAILSLVKSLIAKSLFEKPPQ